MTSTKSYKPPEEIRKASLCGVNLVGARIERIDFYLVDFRCAIYTKAQAQHLSKNGAILPISPIKKIKSHNPVFDAKNADWTARQLCLKTEGVSNSRPT